MKTARSRVLSWTALLAACALASCANPFSDSASTKGPALTVTPGVGRLTASWGPVLGASGYRFEWATAADFSGATAFDSAVSPLVVENTVPGTTYYLRVQANLKSGPSSWSSATVGVTGWTWAPPPKTLDTTTITNPKTIVVDGVSIDVSTSYTVTTVRHETLRYTAAGLTRATLLRTTTTFTDVTGTRVFDTTPVEVTGNWDTGKVWQRLTLGTGTSAPITGVSADRTSFTFDGAVWTLTP